MNAKQKREMFGRIIAAAKRAAARDDISLDESISRHCQAVVYQWPEVALALVAKKPAKS